MCTYAELNEPLLVDQSYTLGDESQQVLMSAGNGVDFGTSQDYCVDVVTMDTEVDIIGVLVWDSVLQLILLVITFSTFITGDHTITMTHKVKSPYYGDDAVQTFVDTFVWTIVNPFALSSYISDVSSGGILSLAFDESVSLKSFGLFMDHAGRRMLESAAAE